MADEVELIGAGALSSDLVRLAQPGGAFDDATRAAADQLLAPAAANTRSAIPQVSGAMAASVNVAAEAYGAALSEGDGIAYAGWVDFGGARPQSGVRPYLPEGRYLFPAVGDLDVRATSAFDDALQGAVDRFGWTNQGTNPGAIHG